ncbi:glycerol-3-phosphate dehydrogenase/oxidase, partial [Myxococcota bacterium]|nr:glycerol-3-phosphate dehydrogenase/oxidase [Myxococcota bacterium]
ARRGLRVGLFERGDLGAGTSGASSGMIHGGIRYLETDRATTHKSCLDSGYIQQIAPHLLFRIPVIFPLLSWMPRGRILNELAFVYFQAYDRFQPLKRGKRAAKLTREEVLRLEPGVHPDVTGGVSTDEWGIDVFRLCLLNALDAQAHGAEIHLYHQVERLLRDPSGRVLGVRVRDLKTGTVDERRARIVFNAAGPWADKVAGLAGARVPMRPGKGIHLVLDRRIVNYALLASAADGRQVFLEPYGQETWIGTTDTDFYGDPGEVVAHHDEVMYLLEAIETVFPAIRQHRIVRAFAGVRPTLRKYGPAPDALSRRHEVFDHSGEGAPGLMSMGGGKLAAYRLMAEEATDAILKGLNRSVGERSTHTAPLPGGESTPDVADVATRAGIAPYTAARLIHRHGARVEAIVERVARDPESRQIVCQCEPVIEAEIEHALAHERVSTLEDLRRRTRCGGGACQGVRCAHRAARLIARHEGADEGRVIDLLADFAQARWREQAPVAGHQNLPHLERFRWRFKGFL